jgi:hypothetical protein
MDRPNRERSSDTLNQAHTDPEPVEPTRVVLHLTPEAVAEGFLALDEPGQAAERFPKLVARFARGEGDERKAILALADRAIVAPLYDIRTTDPGVLRYLRELSAGAFRDDYRPPDLLAYVTLDFPSADEARRFLSLVAVVKGVSVGLPGVLDEAYLEPAALESTDSQLPPPACSPDVMAQRFFDVAPCGLNVDALGGFAGADGAGVRLYDLELRWGPTHAAVPPPALAAIGGASANAVHHLSVMGVICTNHGMRPVAPTVAYGHASPYDASGQINHAVACATALSGLGPGDVLLYEYSVTHATTNTDHAPPECAPAVFDLIAAATRRVDPATGASLGVHVVTAAGNGAWQIDRATGRFSKSGTSPRTVLRGDSGAVVVGAADALVPHRRWRTSNGGTRIDCYAWGEKLVTATKSFSGGTAHDAFTCGFGETSGAAAVIAGAVAALQGIAHAAGHGPIDPLQLRTWLNDPTLGTPVHAYHTLAVPRAPYLAGGDRPAVVTAPIGSMPDLGRVAGRLMGW